MNGIIEMDGMPDPKAPLYEVKANLFKGLAHPVRIRVLELLAAAETLPVSDILASTGLEASHLSQHLSVLRRHHLVVATRRGTQVFYELAYPQVADLLSVARELLLRVLQTTQEHLELSVTPPSNEAPATLEKKTAS
ncbi:MAG: metalloregulator ArsR/SmtB family transcription factor [Specibacter sp.]